MANISPITHATFVDGTTVIDAAFLNAVLQKLNALIEAHNNADLVVSTSGNLLSISDANGNEILRLNNSLEVKADKTLLIGGVQNN